MKAKPDDEIIQKVRKELNKIGWKHVKSVTPNKANFLAQEILNIGAIPTPRDDKSQVSVLADLEKHLIGCLSAASEISNFNEISINIGSTPFETRDFEILSAVDSTVEQIEKILPSVQETLSVLRSSSEKIKRGPPVNFRVHGVARAIAQIYVIGLGEIPKVSVRPVTGSRNSEKTGESEPSSKYGQVA